MSKTITIIPGNRQFVVEDSEMLLDAGLRQGVQFAYGCRNGACGACKAKVVSGEVEAGAYQPFALSEQERSEGIVLLCCATALTNATVEPKVPVNEQDQDVAQISTYKGTIVSLMYQQDIAIMRLVLPIETLFSFRAGQYIDFLFEGDKRRSFSLGNAPQENGVLELHIRRQPGGYFSEKVFGHLKIGDNLTFEGPLGSFYLHDDHQPLLFVVGGTGFAPVKSMVESMRSAGIQRTIKLYWGARNIEGFYMDTLAKAWADTIADFQYIPVLSEEIPADWTGRHGLVHQAVLDDLSDLSQYHVYVCGAPPMVEAAHDAFVKTRHLPETSFYSDAFYLAAKTDI